MSAPTTDAERAAQIAKLTRQIDDLWHFAGEKRRAGQRSLAEEYDIKAASLRAELIRLQKGGAK